MLLVRLISSAAFLSWSFTPLYAGDIEGRAKPVDGDSFNIEIRIFGIDAPEPGQTCKDAHGLNYSCGRQARDAMAEMLRGKTVRCEKQDQDTKNGRPVAICYADNVDVGAAMVDRGLAVAYRDYSLKYVPNEEQAKAAVVIAPAKGERYFCSEEEAVTFLRPLLGNLDRCFVIGAGDDAAMTSASSARHLQRLRGLRRVLRRVVHRGNLRKP